MHVCVPCMENFSHEFITLSVCLQYLSTCPLPYLLLSPSVCYCMCLFPSLPHFVSVRLCVYVCLSECLSLCWKELAFSITGSLSSLLHLSDRSYRQVQILVTISRS